MSKIDKILNKIKQVEQSVSELKYMLSCPDGIRITAVWDENNSIVEYWNGDSVPILLGQIDEKVEEPVMQQWIFDCMSRLPLPVGGEKIPPIELYCDMEQDDLASGIKAAIDIFEIKCFDTSETIKQELKERHELNNNLSPQQPVQGHDPEELPIRRFS